MHNSTSTNAASLRQSITQEHCHCCTGSRTLSDVPTTLMPHQNNLLTPTTSTSGRELGNNDGHGGSNDPSSRASPRHMPENMQIFQGVCEWVSTVEPGNTVCEDEKYESTSEWVHLSKSRSLPAAERQLDRHKPPTSDAQLPHPAHQFAGVVDELAKTAVEGFRSVQVSPQRKRSMSPCPEKCRKRSRLGPGQDPTSAGSNSDSEERSVVLFQRPTDTAPRIWPCPFFVRDRVSYLSCWTRHCLLTLEDVREHLCSVHLEPIHCSVCFETFPTVTLRDTHMRSRDCLHQLPVIFDGLRDSQVRELQRQGKSDDKLPCLRARQWVKMWCIVFSCTQLPPSPFSFSQREFAVYEFRQFWETHGENIIADVMAKYRLQDYKIENEERSLQALYSLVADHAVDCLVVTQDHKDV